MKKITLLTLLMAVTLHLFSQTNTWNKNHEGTTHKLSDGNIQIEVKKAYSYVIRYDNWSNPYYFNSPIVTGYGEYSDSLSKVYDGKSFYIYDNEYYLIESWADYYLWFTKRFWYNFTNPELYEVYYITDNDYGMASYIASHYNGAYYPSLIKIDFLERSNEMKGSRLINEEFLATDENKANLIIKEPKNINTVPKKNTNIEHNNLPNHQNIDNIKPVKKEKIITIEDNKNTKLEKLN